MDETSYWAHLAAIEGTGAALFDALLQRFGSIKRALEAPLNQLEEIPRLDGRTREALARARQTLPATQAKIAALARLGIQVKTMLDNSYPAFLRMAPSFPPVIYQAGELQSGDEQTVALIGSRDCTQATVKRAKEYAGFFAQQGLTVISGYAEGVDLSAHLGALQAGGRTIIIPGCGTDHFDFTPLQPLGIGKFSDLAQRGIWISEQPPEADWSSQGSLARNRLVAAGARVILILEARLQSSTLDTVTRARALGKPIFVQSFSTISQRVMGNEKLRREGAELIQEKKDLDRIVDHVKGSVPKGKKLASDDPRR